MIFRLLTFSLLFVFSTELIAQNNTFYRKYNLSGMNGGLALQPTSDGGFVAAGQHEGNGSAGGCDIYVYRVDECGNRLWFKIIGEGATDGAKSIQELSSGEFLLSGHYDGTTGFVAKLDANGNLLWLNTFPGLEWVFQASECANGEIICVAKQPNTSCVLMRLSNSGVVLWSNYFNNFGQMPLYVKELTNGEIVFLSTYNVPGKDLALAKTDANGNIIWSMGYGFGYTDVDHTSWSCSASVNEINNTILVTTPSQNQGGLGGDNILAIEASTVDGSVLWSKSFGGPGSDQSRAVIATPFGYAICGNSDSYPVAAGANLSVTEAMSERNILLMHIDFQGNIIWSRQYGAAARDKGIGVGYGSDGSFTMSAYTASGYFGNTDASMDPLFIKTDSLGLVTCQTADCPLTGVDISSNASPIGSITPIAFSASNRNPVVSDFVPNDVYQCQDCYTVPYFELSDSLVCVGDTVLLYNLTTIGLTCFQEWQIDGQVFDGNTDTLAYSFSVPGLYHVILNSSCGAASNSYDLTIRVSEVVATGSVLTDYNGFGVSCYNGDNGSMEIVPLGGYFPTNQGWNFQWTPGNIIGASPTQLGAGVYSCIVSDEIGCLDTVQLEITQPLELQDSLFVSSNYNGYAISCYGNDDGTIETAQNFPSGGVAPYTSQIISPTIGATNNSPVILNNLFAGNVLIQTTDANGCSVNQQLLLNQPSQLISNVIVIADTCGTGVGAFIPEPSGGVPSYSIDFNGIINAQTQDFDQLSSGNYSIQINDLNGCSVTESFEVNMVPGSNAEIGTPSSTVCIPEESVFFDLSGPYQIASGTWDFGDGTIQSYSGAGAIHTYDEPGDYFVQLNITDIHGCIDETSITVHIKPDLRVFVPNTFSPNNDRINDAFMPIISGARKYHLWVYNRWGDVVFETENVDQAWNGSPDNRNLSSQQETYTYKIEVQGSCGNSEIVYGTVLLIR